MSAHSLHKNLPLHGLRGVLALSLLVFHVAHSGLPSFAGWLPEAITYTLLSLEHGVELFFGISGIVILFAYQKSRGPLEFLVNRATRIYPVLWVTVAVILALSTLQTDKAVPHDVGAILANMLALPPLITNRLIHPAAWSLSYEFAFYGSFILFGLLARTLPKRAAFAVTLLAGLAMAFYHPRALWFLIGLGIGLQALRQSETQAEPPRRTRIDSGILLLLAMLALHTCYREVGDLSAPLLPVLLTPKACLLLVAALVLSYAGMRSLFHGHGRFARLLCSRTVQFLGTISYSLYLWQTIVMAIAKKLFYMLGAPEMLGPWSQLVFFIVVLPPTLVVSYFSQRVLELGVTNWLRRRSHTAQAMHHA